MSGEQVLLDAYALTNLHSCSYGGVRVAERAVTTQNAKRDLDVGHEVDASTTVKSADRVLQILHLLGASEPSLRASDIAKALRIPISSCMALLATAVRRGFICFDDLSRAYALAENPVLRRRAPGSVSPLSDATVIRARWLNRELGLGVAVSRRSGLFIEWEFTLGVSQHGAGDSLPLFHTVNGVAVLSRMSDDAVSNFVHRYNEKFGRSNQVSAVEVLSKVRPLRGRDHVSGRSPWCPSMANISFCLADENRAEEVVLSVVMPVNSFAAFEALVLSHVRRLLNAPVPH